MKRETCGACGSPNLDVFLDLGYSPVADAYLTDTYEYAQLFALELAVCDKCKLVQLLEVLDDKTLFGTGYSFYSSASAPLSQYHALYANHIMDMHDDLCKKLVVEIGCNDGDMLRHFHERGYPTLGVDPATGPVAVAGTRGIPVINQPFDALRARMVGQGEAGVVVANHVLAHVPNVFEFLSGVAHVLAPNGVAYVEVQYVADLLTNNAFDLVYHEHRNFFSLTSLELAVNRVGLHVANAQLTQRQGGSLRVMLTHKKPTGAAHTAMLVQTIREQERWLNDARSYVGVQGRAERIRTRLLDEIYAMTSRGEVLAGFGAPAKATTLLNFCGISREHLSHVVDSTEAKHGRYIPGTGLLIIPETDDTATKNDIVDAYLLLAWNYARTIMRNHSDYNGSWIVPIPAPVVL